LPIAKQAHYDDEVFLRIERHSLADQPFVVFDLARVPLPGLRDVRLNDNERAEKLRISRAYILLDRQ
jgi:hypothetical protein